jgi:DNA-binding transcriptional regulator GbsR (MarR family)
MKTTKENIIEYIKNRGSVSAKDLIDHIGISKQAIFIHLKKLIEDGLISKVGNPPVVFYVSNKNENNFQTINFKEEIKKEINKKYLFITSIGEIKEGVDGFIYWCNRNNLDPIKTANEYIETLKKYDKYRQKSGLINGIDKIKASFKEVFLDKIFYLDFYAIERFGKTKLGQLLLYSKQSQDKKMIRNLSISIRGKIMNLINEYKIDAVCFIPPTVKREVQLMKELENNLKLPVKRIKIVKIKSDIAVPQKTLNKIRDRIENAERTFFLDDKGTYGNVLLIDDAVGSGATLNIVAGKIRQAKLTKGKIIGLAITGSYKGFDVISEV